MTFFILSPDGEYVPQIGDMPASKGETFPRLSDIFFFFFDVAIFNITCLLKWSQSPDMEIVSVSENYPQLYF